MHRPEAYSGWMCLVTHCCITQIAAAKWDITLQLLPTTAASCSTCGNPFETSVLFCALPAVEDPGATQLCGTYWTWITPTLQTGKHPALN
jgi:hypothetical protein